MIHVNGVPADLSPPAPDLLPPQDLEAESGVLGSMLLENTTIDDVIGLVDPEHFYRAANEILCRAIFEMWSAGTSVDAITVEDHLRASGELDKVGGLDAILHALGSVPHAANARHYADIVKDRSRARRLLEHAQETQRECYRGAGSDAMLAAAESRVLAIGEDKAAQEARPASELAARRLADIDRMKATGVVPGIRSGWRDVDDITCGFKGGQLVVLAARPSMGKSAYAIQLASSVSDLHGLPSLFISLEMGGDEVGGRLMSLLSGVEYYRHSDPRRLTRSDQELLGEAQATLRDRAPILVDDTPTMTMTKIGSAVRRHRARSSVGLLVVDYIQLIDSPPSRDSRQEVVAQISRGLKVLARDLGIPVVALSQLNRKAEEREDHRPRMSDLRETGAIEQDADAVILLHRPEYYDPNDQPNIAEVIVAKNRNGPTGTAKLVFHKGCMRFDNLAEAVAPSDF